MILKNYKKYMINNKFNTNSSSHYDAFPKQFINYVNYELSLFEKITNKKFFFNISSNDRFELSVCETKDKDENDNDNNNKSNCEVVYRANNIYQFIKRLFMIREHLIKNFSIKQ
jgi:hypothetical protein